MDISLQYCIQWSRHYDYYWAILWALTIDIINTENKQIIITIYEAHIQQNSTDNTFSI